jgi:hypothetical protein
MLTALAIGAPQRRTVRIQLPSAIPSELKIIDITSASIIPSANAA